MRRLVTIAGDFTILEFEFHDLDGTAPLFVAIFLRVVTAPARMGEVKQKRALAAHHHIRMAAEDLVIHARARLLEQVLGLPLPFSQIVRLIHSQPAPVVHDHPVAIHLQAR